MPTVRDRIHVNTNSKPEVELRIRFTPASSLSRGDTILWTTWRREPQWGLFLSATPDPHDDAITCLHVAPAQPDWDDTIDLEPHTPVQRVLNPQVLGAGV